MADTAMDMGQVMAASAGGVVRIGRGAGRGAGFVLRAGHVATNAHNLRGEQATVTFADGRSDTGQLVGFDPDGDLAVLAVDTGDAAPLVWSDRTPGLADPVVTLTHDAVAGVRVTRGWVSAVGAAFRSPRGRLVADALEHTAPLARGSSGGPVLDAGGRLAGINTHRRGDGFYLALPATPALRERLDELAAGAARPRPRLGVAIAPPEVSRGLREAVGLPGHDGLLVRGVDEDGPAAGAGIRRGDLLVEAAGRPLRTSDDLFAVLDTADAGAIIPVVLLRGAEELTLDVALPADD
jgi:serine protease Do